MPIQATPRAARRKTAVEGSGICLAEPAVCHPEGKLTDHSGYDVVLINNPRVAMVEWVTRKDTGEERRTQTLTTLFDREKGAGFSLLRDDIGSSDFTFERLKIRTIDPGADYHVFQNVQYRDIQVDVVEQ